MLGDARVGFGQLTLKPQLAARLSETERARARSARHKPERQHQKRDRWDGVLSDPSDEANEEAQDVLRCRPNPYRIFRRGGANFSFPLVGKVRDSFRQFVESRRRGTQPEDHAPRFPRCAPHPWNELALAFKIAKHEASDAGDDPEDQTSTTNAIATATTA